MMVGGNATGRTTMGRNELPHSREDMVHALRGVVDVLWIVVAHALATWAYGQSWRRETTSATILAIVVFAVTAQLCGLYRPERWEQLASEAGNILLSWTVTVAALVLAAFATKMSLEYSRVISFGWFLL